jgi:hypothetical protein
MLKRLWNDEAGALLSMEVVLVGTILVIGVLTGLTSLRDAVVTELADLGAAISWLDQSYYYHGITAHSSATAPTFHRDFPDYCDDNQTTTASRCVVICNGAFAAPLAGNEGTGTGTGG